MKKDEQRPKREKRSKWAKKVSMGREDEVHKQKRIAVMEKEVRKGH